MKLPIQSLIILQWCKEMRKDWHAVQKYSSEFDCDERFIFLGNVEGMPGHCMVICLRDNRIYGPWHNDNFENVPEEEI